MVITSSFFCISCYHLCDLPYHVLQIQYFVPSAATKRHSVWNTYLKFCDFYNLQPFPASPFAFITLVSFSVESHHHQQLSQRPAASSRLLPLGRFSLRRHSCQTDAERSGEVHDSHSPPQSTFQAVILLLFTHSLICAVYPSGLFLHLFSHSQSRFQTFDSFSPQHALSRGSVNFNDSGAFLTVTRTKTRKEVIPPLLFQFLTFTLPTNNRPQIITQNGSPPLTHVLSSLSLPPQTNSPVSRRSPSTIVLSIWRPLSLWIHGNSLVTVFVEAALHSPISAVSQQSLLSFKKTGDLTLTCCIYHCL